MFFDFMWIFCCITASCSPEDNKALGLFSSHKIATKQISHKRIQTQVTSVPTNYVMSTTFPVITAKPMFGALYNIYTTPKIQSSLKSKLNYNVKDTHKNKVPTKSKISLNNQFENTKPQEKSHYTTRYDYIDIKAFVHNERLVKVFFNCFIDKGPCTREGLELKRHIPEILQTECAKCTYQQRKQIGQVISYLIHNKPFYLKILWERFDPDSIYLNKILVNDDFEIKTISKDQLNQRV
ncbi:uncharacterized protein LOC126905723 [Daktulosphaira vitifoliae]|uniref:uncharacterized protein LOC126905723 n=1 Tax=Daktulosphaira vitifoliae TaxID=58002 RepID=UPI0021AAEEAC|nr:uncharacterized protein LOC126905723 [Daktulosphaira vitifoliae]XP_050541671.1 uncharacterized protein LOC126905723 [Daktulosphaira vitifoliae]